MTCHGCHLPIEPLAAIRTYHSGCDPQGRVEMLERVLRPFVDLASRILERDDALHLPPRADLDGVELVMSVREVKAARAALEYRPAQMKGRE